MVSGFTEGLVCTWLAASPALELAEWTVEYLFRPLESGELHMQRRATHLGGGHLLSCRHEPGFGVKVMGEVHCK